MFSWLKYLRSFISRRVLRQNIEWSKGVIFLIATFCPDGLWSAELWVQCQHHNNSNPRRSIPNYSISSLANNVLNIILLADIEGDLPRPRRVGLTLGHAHIASGCISTAPQMYVG